MKHDYGTLSQTINALKEDGYTFDFNLQNECLECHHTNLLLSPEDFEIDAVYRFEGESNPDDESILYAISSTKYNVKGVLVNAYSIYSDEYSTTIMSKLSRHH